MDSIAVCAFFGLEIYAQNAKPFVIPELKAWIGKKVNLL